MGYNVFVSVSGDAARPTRLGRYELITRIGQGGMAEVQLALQRGPAGFEKLVVVKLVHENLATQKTFVDMLLDEARVAALVKHPNVVDIYDLGQAEGRYFIAMEYLEGEPLLAVLRAGREGKRLDPLSTGRLIADTAEGLDAAHELRSMSGEHIELVHHDISLGNIVVLYNGQVKLVDFGVAKATMSAGPKAKVQGKFSYMAPEKLKGAQGDRRSDIFSLGCVMWEALTLKRLFRGGNDNETMKQVLEMAIQPPSKVNKELPPEYDPIVMRALERDPLKRYMSAKELAVEIEELLRKRGFGAKNDKIAKYMQETFKSHIDARKKLVQEVVAKGTASVEVLDAAFAQPEVASGSPVTPVGRESEFSMKYRRITPATGIPVLGKPWADASGKTEISSPPVMPTGEFSVVTEVSAPPIDPASVEDSRPIPAPVPPSTRPLDRVRDLAGDVWADPTKKKIAIGAAAGLLVVIVLLFVMSGGGKHADAGKGNDEMSAGSGSEVVAEGSSAAAVEPTGSGSAVAVEPTGSDVGSGSAEPTGSGSAEPTGSGSARPGSDTEIVMEPNEPHHVGSGSAHHVVTPPQPPPANAEDLWKQGNAAFMRGDLPGAIGLLTRAKAAKPGFANTWRTLGLVYEKQGNKSQAKSAFQRYLTLAPNAGDAALIRDRMNKL